MSRRKPTTLSGQREWLKPLRWASSTVDWPSSDSTCFSEAFRSEGRASTSQRSQVGGSLCTVTIAFIILVVVLISVLVAFGVTLVRSSSYRATHTHTVDEVKALRGESVRGSSSVRMGQIQEHLAPLLPAFADKYSLRDARFMGAPVDYVVFDGLEAGRVTRLVLVEIKTGTSTLNDNQRMIRDAVKVGIPVEWDLVRLDQLGPLDQSPVPEESL
jgi:predicted Holliday junction resolvase-like endonuclease